jgi:glycosyltransferase involved in cell wall biosynthesis
MRIVLAVHGFPPHECTGVETHVEALARALARRGLEIEVFSTRADPRAPDFSLRSEQREGFRLTWVVQNRVPQSAREHAERPGAVAAFAEFLERVRPQLVHFHHVHKLGLGCLELAAQRNIPSVFTAHDYFSVCHRIVLSRPDLQRCETLGDAAACARCDGAVSYLDSLQRWSDWQVGVFANTLAAQEQRELGRLLEQDGATIEERAALDRRRSAAFAALDLVLAPSEFLRERLIEGGLDGARIERCAYGIE